MPCVQFPSRAAEMTFIQKLHQPLSIFSAIFLKKFGHFLNLTSFSSGILAGIGVNFYSMGRGNTLWARRLILVRQLFSAVLAISFVLSPVSVAFAQEAGSDTPPTTDAASSTPPPEAPPQADSAPTLSIPGVDSNTPNDGGGAGNSPASVPDSSAPDQTSANTPSTPPVDGTQSPTTPTPLAAPPPSGFGSDNQPTIASQSVFSLANAMPKADGQTGALTNAKFEARHSARSQRPAAGPCTAIQQPARRRQHRWLRLDDQHPVHSAAQ